MDAQVSQCTASLGKKRGVIFIEQEVDGKGVMSLQSKIQVKYSHDG